MQGIRNECWLAGPVWRIAGGCRSAAGDKTDISRDGSAEGVKCRERQQTATEPCPGVED